MFHISAWNKSNFCEEFQGPLKLSEYMFVLIYNCNFHQDQDDEDREVTDVVGAATANQKRMRTDPIELMLRSMSAADWDEGSAATGVPLTCRPS